MQQSHISLADIELVTAELDFASQQQNEADCILSGLIDIVNRLQQIIGATSALGHDTTTLEQQLAQVEPMREQAQENFLNATERRNAVASRLAFLVEMKVQELAQIQQAAMPIANNNAEGQIKLYVPEGRGV